MSHEKIQALKFRFQVDSNGNTILHLLVFHNLSKVYTKFKQRWIEEQQKDDEPVTPIWKRLNRDGFTPLTLAAKLGQEEMFSFLLEERIITQWSFGPVSCVLYPLDQVDLGFEDEVRA